MKIRIKGDTVRLRLTKTEVNEFGTKGFVEESTQFGADSKLVYTLKKSDCDELEASFNHNKIEVRVPHNMASKWVDTEQVGMNNNENDNTLKILIEKDFACLTERVGEDESDMFPHPEGETHNC